MFQTTKSFTTKDGKKQLLFHAPKHFEELEIEAEVSRRLMGGNAFAPNYAGLFNDMTLYIGMSRLVEVVVGPDAWISERKDGEGENRKFLNADYFYTRDPEFKEVRKAFSDFLNAFQGPESDTPSVSKAGGSEPVESPQAVSTPPSGPKPKGLDEQRA